MQGTVTVAVEKKPTAAHAHLSQLVDRIVGHSQQHRTLNQFELEPSHYSKVLRA